jgi:hypothetical protein
MAQATSKGAGPRRDGRAASHGGRRRRRLREAQRRLIELHSTRAEVADFLDRAGYEHALIETDVPTREAPWTAHVLARPRGARL